MRGGSPRRGRCGTAYPSGGRGFSKPRGAAPRRAPTRRGPPFSRETGERARGEVLPSGLPLLWFGGSCKGSSFFLPGLRPMFPPPVTARPQLGGLGQEVLQTGRVIPTPKAFPRGKVGLSEAGSDEGRSSTQPFLVEIKKGAPGCRPNGVFLLLRWASRSPPHQSPSVTASPKGKPP